MLMRMLLFVFLLSLVVLTSLCVNQSPSRPYSPTNPMEVVSFLNEAKENLNKCNKTLKSPLNPQSDPAYLNMTILNETTLRLKGELYEYAVLGVGEISFSGEVSFRGYQITWSTPKNLTTTGGQRIDFRIQKGNSIVGSFVYWYIPFQLDSYCVSIYTKPLELPEEEITFVFIHTEGKDLWMVVAKKINISRTILIRGN